MKRTVVLVIGLILASVPSFAGEPVDRLHLKFERCEPSRLPDEIEVEVEGSPKTARRQGDALWEIVLVPPEDVAVDPEKTSLKPKLQSYGYVVAEPVRRSLEGRGEYHFQCEETRTLILRSKREAEFPFRLVVDQNEEARIEGKTDYEIPGLRERARIEIYLEAYGCEIHETVFVDELESEKVFKLLEMATKCRSTEDEGPDNVIGAPSGRFTADLERAKLRHGNPPYEQLILKVVRR